MTSTEFNTRLANGDKLAVVMNELWLLCGIRFEGLELQPAHVRLGFEMNAAHIIAALASAEGARVGRSERLKYDERNDSAEAKTNTMNYTATLKLYFVAVAYQEGCQVRIQIYKRPAYTNDESIGWALKQFRLDFTDKTALVIATEQVPFQTEEEFKQTVETE